MPSSSPIQKDKGLAIRFSGGSRVALRRWCLLVSLLSGICAAWADGSPIGLWKVMGDRSGEAEALVRIMERDGRLEGRIVTVFPRPDVDPEATCEACPGARRNQPLKGLLILSGLKRDGKGYSGGEILDPDSGDLYRCSLEVSADNRQLFVRGYLGVSFFGRTQTWVREGL